MPFPFHFDSISHDHASIVPVPLYFSCEAISDLHFLFPPHKVSLVVLVLHLCIHFLFLPHKTHIVSLCACVTSEGYTLTVKYLEIEVCTPTPGTAGFR